MLLQVATVANIAWQRLEALNQDWDQRAFKEKFLDKNPLGKKIVLLGK